MDNKSQQVSASPLRHSLQDRLSKGASGKNRDEINLKLRTSTCPHSLDNVYRGGCILGSLLSINSFMSFLWILTLQAWSILLEKIVMVYCLRHQHLKAHASLGPALLQIQKATG